MAAEYQQKRAQRINAYEQLVRDGDTPEQAWEAACRHANVPVTPLLGAA